MEEKLVWITKDGQFWQVPESAVERHLESGFERSNGPEETAPVEPQVKSSSKVSPKPASKARQKKSA